MKTTEEKQQALIEAIKSMQEKIWHITQQEACFKALGKDLPIAIEDELSDLEVKISELYTELYLK